jgi:hypothetical protein
MIKASRLGHIGRIGRNVHSDGVTKLIICWKNVAIVMALDF